MRIIYGVQCTGNGHLSRAREIVRGLRRKGHDVHVILTGRNPALLTSVEELAPFTAFHGIYYLSNRGNIDYVATARNLNFRRFLRDMKSIDGSGYDLAVTDFEPMTSRIARQFGIPSVAIGHQYSFMYDIPMAPGNAIGRAVLRYSAPAQTTLALHWHHFGQPILPPVIPGNLQEREVVRGKVLVYLPFENDAQAEAALRPIEECDFFVYGLRDHDADTGHIHWRSFSRSGFLADLSECEGVVCNAGFELSSEALCLGRKLLLKPLHGQMEQESNVVALEALGWGSAMNRLDTARIREWLSEPIPRPVLDYRHVGDCIVDWLDARDWNDVGTLLSATWGSDAPKLTGHHQKLRPSA